MSTEGQMSITFWIGDLIAHGDPEAARRLWERHYDRVLWLAHAKLRRMRRPDAFHDAEDVALSALKNVFVAARRGKFSLLKDRNDLWWLLVTITARKAHDLVERENRLKRGGGREVASESAIADLADAGPSPEDAAIMIEEFRRLLDALGDATLRQIALWKMEGFTNDQIAARLGCARRTVANKLDLIRKRWGAGDLA
jgi:RNA polymerase sigma factor (sigma-70 family)